MSSDILPESTKPEIEPDWLNAETCIENAQIAYGDATEDEDGTPVDLVAAAGDIGVLLGLARYALDARQRAELSFQRRVEPWMLACFGEMIAGDREERNHRFLEEALELVQSCGCTTSEAHQLVDYVFGRPIGEPRQETGGVMITLAALCLANGLDMHEAGETELARIWTKVEAIRAKQAAKPKHSPLPQLSSVKMTPEEAIARVAQVAQAIGWQAGVGGMETAGTIVSYLAVHPERIAPFLAEGESPVDWPDFVHGGCLTWHAQDGGELIHPTNLQRAPQAATAA